MQKEIIPSSLRAHPEFQSALVRLGIWAFLCAYIGIGTAIDYYHVNLTHYLVLFGVFLVFFLWGLVSVIRRPEWAVRRYITLAGDVAATSFSIFLTREPISPFYLMYIWIFVSYGTRYGRQLLQTASIVSVLAYGVVLAVLGDWREHSFEAFFFLLLLIMLPLYEYALLRKLRAARQVAEEANAARGRFLATMTHELRTPLSGIIGMSRLLGNTRLDAQQRDHLNAIQSAAGTLESLIGDVLDLSKIDAERLQLERRSFDLRTLALDVCRNLQGQALEKGLELVCDMDAALPRQMEGDALRVRQILYNLLGNAVKFTEEGEVRLDIHLREAGGETAGPHVEVVVTDTGIGIPPEQLEKVFEAFTQVDDSMTRRYGGTGLGVTIARELALLMGGDMGAESEEGVGSRFWVRLPLLPAQPEPLQLPPALEGRNLLVYESNRSQLEGVERMCHALGMDCVPVERVDQLALLGSGPGSLPPVDVIVISDSPTGQDVAEICARIQQLVGTDVPLLHLGYAGRKPNLHYVDFLTLNKPFDIRSFADAVLAAVAPPGESTPPLLVDSELLAPLPGRPRVLVAEDDAISAKLIHTLLVQADCQVTLVENGEAALREAATGRYELALVDLRMPVMDGLSFTRLLRESEPEGEAHLPVVAITANTLPEVQKACLEAGMDAFLGKPVEPEALQEVLGRLLPEPA